MQDVKPHTQRTRFAAIGLYTEEGKTMLAISEQLGVSYTCVRTWIKRYKAQGEKGLIVRYSRSGRRPQFSQQVIEKACRYKETHCEWGAGFILLKLEDDFPGEHLPRARRLQQIFKERRLQPQRNHLPNGSDKWAKQPFDRVQVDAKERLHTADGQPCCYLNFTDEFTGSELDAFIFPLCSHL